MDRIPSSCRPSKFLSLFCNSDPLSFAQLVRAYEFLPLPFVNLYALTAPWAWILISFALILGPKTKLNTILYALVMFSFMIALGQASLRQLDITCGCFAIEGIEPSTSAALFRDVIFLIPVYWLWKNGTETWFWQLWSTRQIQKS
jgi:hypothetical protein